MDCYLLPHLNIIGLYILIMLENYDSIPEAVDESDAKDLFLPYSPSRRASLDGTAIMEYVVRQEDALEECSKVFMTFYHLVMDFSELNI